MCSCSDGSKNIDGKCHQQPGGSCSDGQFCTGGSSCDLALCRCPPGRQLEKKRCVLQTAQPGDPCQGPQKCASGSFCRFGVCMCSAGYRIVDGQCKKLKDISVGGTSIKGPEVQAQTQKNITETSRCDLSEEAVVKKAPGQCCKEDSNCSGGSVCLQAICVCPGGENSNGKCIPNKVSRKEDKGLRVTGRKTKSPGSPCRLTIECPYRTECARGLCRCRQGETIINGVCRKAVYEVLPGGKCNSLEGLDCIGESQCIYGKCACKLGMSTNGKECISHLYLKNALPGDSCGEGQTCTKGSLCIDNLCQCRDIEMINDEGECVLSLEQESKISSSSPSFARDLWKTVLAGASKPNESQGNINQYLTAHRMSINVLDENLFRLLLGSENAESNAYAVPCKTACSEGSLHCTSNKCNCPPGYKEEKGNCVVISKSDREFLKIMEKLNKLEKDRSMNASNNNLPVIHLVGSGSVHSTGVASLSALSSTERENMNSYIGFPGGRCSAEGTCSYGARCVDNVCVCEEEFIDINGVCLLGSVPLGGGCEINEQCATEALCVKGICRCKEGFDEDRFRCKPSRNLKTTKACKDGDGCAVTPRCRNGGQFCTCPEGMAYTDGICISHEKSITCNRNEDCGRFALCRNGYCYCEFGYEKANGECVLSPALSNTGLPLFPRTDFGQDNIENTIEDEDMRYISQDGYYDSKKRLEEQRQVDTAQNLFDTGTLGGRNNIWPVEDESELDTASSLPYEALTSKNLQQNMFPFSSPNLNLIPLQGYPFWLNNIASTYLLNGFSPPYFPPSALPLQFPLHASTTVNKTVVGKTFKNEIKKKCFDSSECDEGLHCTNNTCICSENYALQNGACVYVGNAVKSLEKGLKWHLNPLESCDGGDICTGNAYCTFLGDIGPLCVCPLATVLIGKQCISIDKSSDFVEVGSYCREGLVCSGGSSCVRGRCLCPKSRTQIGNYCLTVAFPGERCGSGQLCAGFAQCSKKVNKCLCSYGSFFNGKRCVTSTSSEVTLVNSHLTICETRKSCPKNSYCSLQKTCECFEGFKMVSGICLAVSFLRYPGQECDENAVCINHSQCRDRKCKCLNGRKAMFYSCDYRAQKHFSRTLAKQKRLRKRGKCEFYNCFWRIYA